MNTPQGLWLEPPDSTILIGWSQSFGFHIPTASVWRIVETVIGGLVVAIVAYWLASRRLKTARWHERQREAYGQILKELRVAAKASEDLSTDEDEGMDGAERRTFSGVELEGLQLMRCSLCGRHFHGGRNGLSTPTSRLLAGPSALT